MEYFDDLHNPLGVAPGVWGGWPFVTGFNLCIVPVRAWFALPAVSQTRSQSWADQGHAGRIIFLGWLGNVLLPPGGIGGSGLGEERLDLPAQTVPP